MRAMEFQRGTPRRLDAPQAAAEPITSGNRRSHASTFEDTMETKRLTWELDEQELAALQLMQERQASHVQILCQRCETKLVAWDQKHLTQGRICAVCRMEARILARAAFMGILREPK